MRRAATGLRKSRRRPVPPSMASRSKPPHRATLRSPHGRGLQQLRAEQDRPRHERFRDGPVLVHEGHRRPRRRGFDGPLEGRERVEAAVAAFQHDRAPAVAPLRQVRANPAPSDRRRRHIPRRRDGARQAATAPRRGGALPDAPDRLPALDRRGRPRCGPGREIAAAVKDLGCDALDADEARLRRRHGRSPAILTIRDAARDAGG